MVKIFAFLELEQNLTFLKGLGDLDLETARGIYDIKTKPADIGTKTRGVKIKQKGDAGEKKTPVEFSEASVSLVTKK